VGAAPLEFGSSIQAVPNLASSMTLNPYGPRAVGSGRPADVVAGGVAGAGAAVTAGAVGAAVACVLSPTWKVSEAMTGRSTRALHRLLSTFTKFSGGKLKNKTSGP
jgi:hypothetical protein